MRVGRLLLVTLSGLLGALPAQAGVTINELRVNVAGTDTGYEYVELYNDGGSAVDVSGWTLQVATRPTSWSTKATLPAGTTVPAGGFLVLGESLVPEADVVTDTLAMGNASSSGDAVRILDGSAAVVDTIVYGADSDGFLEDSGSEATSPAPTPDDDDALGRIPDGRDTDVSGDDFVILAEPTPGRTNDVVVTPDCDLAAVGAGIVVNELLANPGGADSVDLEYVELFHGGTTTVDVSGWVLEGGTSSYGELATLPADSLLAPGAFLVVGGASIPEADVPLTGSLPNATSSSDAVRVVDCQGTPVDTVIYGAPNSDSWKDDTEAVADSLAPKPGDDLALARREDGLDTDRSGQDFRLDAVLTPGSPNPEPPPCELGDVVINELLSDPEGADGDAEAEWIELVNAGEVTLTVSGWGLEISNDAFTGSPDLILPDLDLAPGEHLLIGQASVDGADVLLESSLGNGSSSSDGVQLTDCEGAVADTVVYGAPNSDGIVDDTGEVAASLAPTPPSGMSIARVRDGYDTDQSGLDFVVEPAPTPGGANPEGEPVVCVPASGETVLLNEVVVNPEGDDADAEWIELYNPTGSDVSVAGWGIVAARNGDEMDIVDSSLPGGVTVPAGGFLVVGGSLVDAVDVVVGLDLPNGSGGDAVVLVDCEGARIDSVLYGGDNEDLVTDDTGEVVEPYVRSIESGASLSRAVDGADTDTAADWYSAAFPTPGETNAREGGGGPDPRGCGCGSPDPDDVPTEPSGCGSDAPPPAMLGVVVLGLGLVSRRRRR